MSARPPTLSGVPRRAGPSVRCRSLSVVLSKVAVTFPPAPQIMCGGSSFAPSLELGTHLACGQCRCEPLPASGRAARLPFLLLPKVPGLDISARPRGWGSHPPTLLSFSPTPPPLAPLLAQAKIAEAAGAVAVMALERVPADIRKEGGVARMSDPQARPLSRAQCFYSSCILLHAVRPPCKGGRRREIVKLAGKLRVSVYHRKLNVGCCTSARRAASRVHVGPAARPLHIFMGTLCVYIERIMSLCTSLDNGYLYLHNTEQVRVFGCSILWTARSARKAACTPRGPRRAAPSAQRLQLHAFT